MSTRRPGGSGTVSDGYLLFRNGHKKVAEHRLIAERVLSKKLPRKAVVHHVDENRLNNDHANLVICPNRRYHSLIHQRMNALKACSHADWRKCNYCHSYDEPKNLFVENYPNRVCHAWHRSCKNAFYNTPQQRSIRSAYTRRRYAKARLVSNRSSFGSLAHRAKLSAANMGHTVSEETRAKISATIYRNRRITHEHH